MKLLGSVCILLGGASLWCLRMAERRCRRETLREVLFALRRMGEEVRMSRTPLPVLLERLARECETEAAVFFRSGAEAMGCGECWRPEVETLPLPEGAKRALQDLAAGLKGDEENVCKVISLACIELEKEREEAERRRLVEERQLTAVCFSASALLVILLI